MAKFLHWLATPNTTLLLYQGLGPAMLGHQKRPTIGGAINSTSKVTVYYDCHFGHVHLAILKQAPSLKHNLTNLYCSPVSCHRNWEFGHGASQFLKLRFSFKLYRLKESYADLSQKVFS